jgi:carbamoyltransferase
VPALINEKSSLVGCKDVWNFGPRGLGNRSIIADPRSPIMQKQLNLKIKYRESFRPFCSKRLKRRCGVNGFEHYTDSPYMLLVADIQKR